MSALDNCINFWKAVDLDERDKTHPQDKNLLASKSMVITSFSDYLEKWYFKEQGEIHSGLIPQPYIGDISNAKIIFLLLNPGLSPNDYYDEENAEYRKALIDCLYQNNNNKEYFYPLDPQFCWTDSGRWWHKKLKPIIESIINKEKISYLEATKALSKKICAIELFPYHSKEFALSDGLLKKLPSVDLSIKLGNELAENSKKTIICMRRINIWNINTPNTINFEPQECRSAHISEQHLPRIMEKYYQ